MSVADRIEAVLRQYGVDPNMSAQLPCKHCDGEDLCPECGSTGAERDPFTPTLLDALSGEFSAAVVDAVMATRQELGDDCDSVFAPDEPEDNDYSGCHPEGDSDRAADDYERGLDACMSRRGY